MLRLVIVIGREMILSRVNWGYLVAYTILFYILLLCNLRYPSFLRSHHLRYYRILSSMYSK